MRAICNIVEFLIRKLFNIKVHVSILAHDILDEA